MERTINSIVIHHSVTNPNNKDIWAVSVDFNPDGTKKDYHEGYYIGDNEYHGNYHHLIFQDGDTTKAISHDHYTYHCGNLEINKTSLAICFIGDFEENEPSVVSLRTCNKLIQELKEMYPIERVYLHRELFKTACPGKNITLTKIEESNMIMSRDQVDRACLSILKKHATDDDYATYRNAKNEVEMIHSVANSTRANEIYNDAMRYREGANANYELVTEKLYRKK